MKTFLIALTIATLFAATAAVAQSDAQKTFDKLRTLSGSWEGKTSDGRVIQLENRMTSGGSAMLSEIKTDEDMISIVHMDGNRVLMTHYCGAGNQPRFKASMSPDGKVVTFDFLDATNLTAQPDHMQHVVFTIPDANHHSEDWTFVQRDGKELHEHFDLQRTQ